MLTADPQVGSKRSRRSEQSHLRNEHKGGVERHEEENGEAFLTVGEGAGFGQLGADAHFKPPVRKISM